MSASEDTIVAAEAALQRGAVEEARSLAQQALAETAAAAAGGAAAAAAGEGGAEQAQPSMEQQLQGRALAVLIQTDFRCDTLTDLAGSATPLHELPLHVMLLWGVVAVELQEASKARATLSAYMAGRQFGDKSGVSRADALALSRLYAVQLLAGLCHDFDGAADWLEGGGAGLSVEQRDLLLLEVDEAEELLQEEHLEAWATQHAAGAPTPPDGGSSDTAAAAGVFGGSSGAAAAASAASSVAGSAAGGSSSAAHSAAAALQELGPSASGALGSSRASSLHADGSVAQDTHQQQQQEQAVDVAPPPAGMLLAAVAAAGSDGGYCGHGTAAAGIGEPSSPSLAGWRLQDADEGAALPDQCLLGGRPGDDSNAFVTLTGDIDGDFDTAAAAAGAAAGRAGGSGSPSKLRPASRSATQAAAAAAPVPDAAAAHEPEIQAEPAEQQAQQQAQQQQQRGAWALASYQNATGWASSKADEVWGSAAVQGTLKALHLQDVPPWELAGGAGLALLVGFSLYRERRSLKRAAASLAAGVVDTAQMALGLPRGRGGGAVVNAMAAVPGTSHMMPR